MEYFNLRGKKIQVKSGYIYESSQWDAATCGFIDDGIFTLQAIIYTTRQQGGTKQEPFGYIYADRDSSKGIWLNERVVKALLR
jgi:hypothetical protein